MSTLVKSGIDNSIVENLNAERFLLSGESPEIFWVIHPLYLVALIAFFAFLTARNTLADNWYKNKGEIYKEFWKDEQCALARHWIGSDSAFNKNLLPAIEERLKYPVTSHDPDERTYKKLETLDRFIYILVIFREFDSSHSNYRRRILWMKYFHYWTERFNSKGREKLKEYVEVYWPNCKILESPTNTQIKIDKLLRFLFR